MSILRITFLCGAFLAFSAGSAAAEFSWRVESRADIERILPAAAPGDIFELAPGEWGALSLRGLKGQEGKPITIRSGSSENPPRFDSLDLQATAFLQLEGLHIALTSTDLGVDLRAAQNVTLRNVAINGPGAGTGINVTDTRSVLIADSTLTGLTNGIVGTEVRHLSLTGSTMTDLSGSAIDLRGGAWITLDKNRFTNFAAALPQPDQRAPDMVRLAMGRAAPAHVLVKDTLLDSGAGPARPGLVIGDALEQHPEHPPVQDVTISGIVIVTATRNGLVLGPTHGAQITNSAVLRGRQAPRLTEDATLTTPRLRLSQRSREVVLRDNWAGWFPNGQGIPGWNSEGNIILQDEIAGQSNHYASLFQAPDLADSLAGFQPRPGSLLDTPGSGPGLLRPPLTDAPLDTVQTSATLNTQATTFLRYAPDQGTFEAKLAPRADLEVDPEVIPLGDAFPIVKVPREMIGPLFNTRDFTLRLRLRGHPGWGHAGEVLRIHPWMTLSIDNGGGLALDFRSAESTWKRLALRNARINDGAWHHVEIRFDTRSPDGVLSLHHGPDDMVDVPIHGPTMPLQHWPLTLGNPFGDRETWRGEIGGLELSRRSLP